MEGEGGVWERMALRGEVFIDGGLEDGAGGAGGGEEGGGYGVEDEGGGNVDFVVGDGLGGEGNGAGDAAADAGGAFGVGEVLAVGFGDDDDGEGSVGLGVEELDAAGGVPGVAGAVEDGGGVVFLGFVVEDEDDLAPGVEVFVVVVAEFRGGDAEAGEDDGCGDVYGALEGSESLRSVVNGGLAGADEGEGGGGAVGAILDKGEGLEEGGVAGGVEGGGLEAGGGELLGDPLDGEVVAGLETHAAGKGVGGEVGEVCAEGGLLDGGEAFALRGGGRGLSGTG